MVTTIKNNELWVVCLPMARKYCETAKENEQDINSMIYPFKVLLPFRLFDIDDWEDAENFIALAIYKLALHYISKNLPLILKQRNFSAIS